MLQILNPATEEVLREVARALDVRFARRERVQPQHAARLCELAQHVVIRCRVLMPVFRESDDRRSHVRNMSQASS